MSKFSKFVKKWTPLGWSASLMDWLLGKDSKVSQLLENVFDGNPIENLVRGATGSGLTNAQIEQNQWNSEEAQIARDWQERMDNTKYQRMTTDMQAAGLNPAMMYGQSVGASAPSGAQASGGNVGNPQAGVIDSILNVVMAKARIDNLRKNTELMGSQIELNSGQLDEIQAKITELTSQADLNDAQREQVSRLTSWIDKEKSSVIDLQGAQKDYFDAEVRKVEHTIRNLDADTSKKWQEIKNLRQEIVRMIHEINLIDQQAIESSTRASLNMDLGQQVIKSIDEIDAKIKLYDAESAKFRADTGLTHKEIDWYWVNNGLMPGLKLAATAAGAAMGAGMFTSSLPYAGFRPSWMQ